MVMLQSLAQCGRCPVNARPAALKLPAWPNSLAWITRPEEPRWVWIA
uniref:Uncharacterized protein n=1 Tax=Pseudomonas monteilii TaxID=76759 RepID=A0A6B7Q4P7_9PSED|nr:hypothetical protein [Pseudomonas monteilii]